MLYYTSSVENNIDLLPHFERFKVQYFMGLNEIHSHLSIVDKHKELEPIIEKELFESVLDYMSFYSVKHAIGERVLQRNNIEYKTVVDLHFFLEDEVLVVEYIA